MVYAIPVGVAGTNPSAPLLTPPDPPLDVLASDDFNRGTTSDLGATSVGGFEWANAPASGARFQIDADTLYMPATISATARSAIVGAFPSDVSAEVTFVSGAAASNTPVGCHLVVRRNGDTWYGARIRGGGAPNMNYHIIRCDGSGNFTSLLDTGIPRVNGDRVRIDAVGPTISVRINDGIPQSVTDSTYSAGGGVGFVNLPTAGGVLAEFRLDDFVVSVPTT